MIGGVVAEDITYDEWMAELSKLSAADSDTDGMYSVCEMCQRTGKSKATLQRHLQKLHAAGRLVVRRRHSTRIDGVPNTIPVYKILPEKKAKKK